MAKPDESPFDLATPGASALLESLRGVGYAPWTAIADLVDNSVAAGAKRLWISFVWRGASSCIRILDDGSGMDRATLVEAMRPGSRSPREARSPHDLGRFGLGLKTASFSQCRVLTIASRTVGGELVERHWDLDHVRHSDAWQLLKGIPRDVTDEAAIPDDLESGTVVLWTHLDRMVGTSSENDQAARARFFEIARQVERHLAMTHHRFLSGSHPQLRIYFNGLSEQARISPWDPFMQWHPATIATPLERIPYKGTVVEVQGFVLPHRDRLSDSEYDTGAGPEGWLAHEGFFVLRGGRVLVYGGWLALGGGRRWGRDELHRLARIRIDLPNSLDDEWKIDIRKSMATPPALLRPRLRGLAERVRADARDVLAHRGGRSSRAPSESLVRAWICHASQDGASYRIDRSHPSVLRGLDAAGAAAPMVEDMLRIIEATVPVQRIWLDATEHGEFSSPKAMEEPDAPLAASLQSLFRHMTEDLHLAEAEAIRRLLAIEPFSNYPSAVRALGSEHKPK